MSESKQEQAKSLRVLQVCHDYEGPFQNVCSLYCEAFANSHVTTLYLQGPEERSVVEATGGDTVLFFDQQKGSLRGFKLASIFRLAGIFRKNRYDIVIAHRYKAIYLAGIMSYFFPIAVLLGVAHEHKVFKRITRSLFVTFWRRNIHLVAVSDSVRQDVLRYCPSLAVQHRIHTLENALNSQLAAELLSPEEARRELGLPEHVYCYGAVGRLVGKKNHDLLLIAYSEIASPDNCLVIVGSGPKYAGLVSLTRDLGIERNVIFAGNVHRAYRIYRAFDAFVFASGSREAFGIVLLEAMLAEIPIICSDASGPKDVVGSAGLLFEAGNAQTLARQMKVMEKLDSDKRQELQVRGRSRLFAEYTVEQFVRRLHALQVFRGYREL
ncbi:MAG: glycosyltransferase [Gammaproteobacteria bacterium]|nr:glycosyltransferase [Gammaproteobacteria bacterium]